MTDPDIEGPLTWMNEITAGTTTTTTTVSMDSPDSVLFGLGIFSVATIISFIIGLVLKTRLNADLKSVRNSRFRLVQNVRLARLQYKNRDAVIPNCYKESNGMFNRLDPLDYCKHGRIIDQDFIQLPDQVAWQHASSGSNMASMEIDCDQPSSLRTHNSSEDKVGIFTPQPITERIAKMKTGGFKRVHDELFEATIIKPNYAKNKFGLPPTVYSELSKLLSIQLCQELDIIKDPASIAPKRKLYGGVLRMYDDLHLDSSECLISYGLLRCEKAFNVLGLDYAVLRTGQAPSPQLLKGMSNNREFARDSQEYVRVLRAEVKRFSSAMNILKNDMNKDIAEIIRPHVQRCYILKRNIDVLYKGLSDVLGMVITNRNNQGSMAQAHQSSMKEMHHLSSNFYDLYLRPRDKIRLHNDESLMMNHGSNRKDPMWDFERGGGVGGGARTFPDKNY